MNILTYNIRGFTAAKFSQIEEIYKDDLKIDAVVLTETWQLDDTKLPMEYYAFTAPAVRSSSTARAHGGVAVLIPRPDPEDSQCQPSAPRLVDVVSAPKFQMVSVTYRALRIIGAYISPSIQQGPAAMCSVHLARLSAPQSVIVGDLNARHKTWCERTNRAGTWLTQFTLNTRWTIHPPDLPTFCHPGTKATSKIDLFVSKGVHLPFQPRVCRGKWSSDHLPVFAAVHLSSHRDLPNFIPQSVLRNPRVCQSARVFYHKNLPRVTSQLENASCPRSLDNACSLLAETFRRPFLALTPKRKPSQHPAWSQTLTRLTRVRRKLLNAKAPRSDIKDLDKRIRRTFRSNKRKLRYKVLDDMADCPPEALSTHMRRLEVLDPHKKRFSTTMDVPLSPTAFTKHMASIQRPADPISVPAFQPSSPFKAQLKEAILGLKKQKAPGPDVVHSEMLQLEPDLAANAIYTLWQAVGRLGILPKALSIAVVVPLYKDKGDRQDPSNYRPIALLSTLRKAISRTLADLLAKEYSFHKNQHGFRSFSNTEVAIASAANGLRTKHRQAVVLDLKKAYDMTPRAKLLQLVQERLSPPLARMVQALLSPNWIYTRGEAPDSALEVRQGVAQGDSLSPLLFNVFMDPLIEEVGKAGVGKANGFADDILLQAINYGALRAILAIAVRWANSTEMEWNPSKSFIMDPDPPPLLINGVRLEGKKEVTYLGISLDRTGPTDTNVLRRVARARAVLYQMRRLSMKVPLRVRQKRTLVQQRVHSLMDYVSYLQPYTAVVDLAVSNLEATTLSWILNVHIQRKQVLRASLVAGVESYRLRRRRFMLKAVRKFYVRSQDPRDLRAVDCWTILQDYGTTGALVRKLRQGDLERNSRVLLREYREEHRTLCGLGRFPIPVTKDRLPPILGSDLPSGQAQVVAVKIYLNRIPVPQLSWQMQAVYRTLRDEYLPRAVLTDLEFNTLIHRLEELHSALPSRKPA